MKRNYTLNLCYVLCLVIVLIAYPIKNYSAIVNLATRGNKVEKAEKRVGQNNTEDLRNDLLFKY